MSRNFHPYLSKFPSFLSLTFTVSYTFQACRLIYPNNKVSPLDDNPLREEKTFTKKKLTNFRKEKKILAITFKKKINFFPY